METGQEHVKENWVQLALDDYKRGLGIYNERFPNLVSHYNRFTEECFKAGQLDAKTKQLMALSIGVFSNDEYCIIYHTKGALDEGATREEILEAVAVAAALGGGSAMSQGVTLVQDVIQELEENRIH